ncbi:polycystin-1-like protein 1 isoform X2 [Haliotis asinina]
MYVIAATVENEHGSLHKNITVVVMEQRLGDVTFDLHEDSDHGVLKTYEPVKFLVTLETTERQHTFLRVNFGIGGEKKMSLREHKNRTLENSQNVLEASPTLDGFGLAASYGEGCNLSIIFQYTYILEGTYMPQIHVSSNVGYLKMALRQELVIQNELSGPRLQFEDYIMVNRTALFLLHFTKSSVNLSVVWTIFDREKSVVDNFTTSHAQLFYNFTEPGQYELAVTASNMISSVSTVKEILAQTAISGLSITCHPYIFVRLGQEITCTADISSGSGVTFEWNLKDMTTGKKTYGNLTSTVFHSFHQVGVYFISVMASNYISRMIAHLEQPIYVEQEIKSVDVFSKDQLVNQKGLFFIRPMCKCQVNVQFDFGEGRQNYDLDSTSGPNIYRAYNFTSPGVYNVTVYVFNNISNASNMLQVRVYQPVQRFRIQCQGHAIRELPTVFVAKSKGEILRRKEFIYRWTFPGQVTRETLIPMAQFVFKDVGTYYVNLTVTIQNMVDSVSEQLEVRVHERAPAGIWVLHSGIVQTYEVVNFSLHQHEGISRLVVNYSDGDLEEYFRKSSWEHAFSEPGVYKVSVTIYGNGTETKLQSYITAQKPIRAVRIEGPSAIKIENDDRLYTWTAVPDGGSHTLYTWSINNIAANRTTKSSYTLNTFTRAGIKRLKVQAENDVSQVQATLNLTVQYPIVSIQLDIPATPLGTLTNISIIVNGGLNFSVSCHFGDGTVTTSSSQLHKGGVATVHKAHDEKGIPPVYHMIMSHIYSNTGLYDVNVTVSNLFSAVDQVSKALVDEPISGINMLTNSDTLVPVGEVVTVSVKVASGRDLTFKWKLTDVNSNAIEYYIASEVYSEANTSNVTYIFIVPNKYRVSVIIMSALYNEPVEATLPKIFHAVQKITSVNLRADMAAAAVDEKIEITATIEEGSDVVCLFDFGDGHTAQKNGTMNILNYITCVVAHTFTQVGVYHVSVTAINPLGNVTAVLKPFYVQVPPTLHRALLLDKTKYCFKFGENITLVARIPTGTNISYNWQLDDETELIDTGERITHNYRTIGRKSVKVTAYNRVDKIEGFASVDIFNEIQGVNLTASRDVVGTMERLEYVAIPEPNIKGTVEFYKWTFDEYVQSTENYISFAFSSPGKHVVTVAANNCISRAVSKPLEIMVMSKLRSLAIHVKGESLVHQPIKFTATFWSGDNLNFTWDFGDGSPIVQGINETAVHSFNRTGEFIVNLTAVNDISGDSVTVQLFILKWICKPPEITIPGTSANKFTFFHSDRVHIETAVKINCSSREEVTYKWSFTDADGTLVQPMRTDGDMLDKQTLILQPRSLAPGMYRANVKVGMYGTIVYSMASVEVIILPTPLKSVIEGGMQRTIGRQETLYLDGSNSRDLDNPHNASLRFNWTCQSLPRYDLCYNITAINIYNTNNTDIVYDSVLSQLVLTSAKVAVPAGFLLQDDSYFLFTLVVSTPDGRKATSDQVIKVKEDNQTISLKISCLQCRGGLVNMDDKISLRTECINCPDNITYTWKISLIENSFSEPEQDYRSECRPEDASGQQSLVLSVVSWIQNNASTTTTTVPPKAQTSSSFPPSTTRKITESVLRNRGPAPGCGQMFNEDLSDNKVADDLHLDLLQEGLSNGRQIPREADSGLPQVVREGTSGKRPIGRPQVLTSGINEELTQSNPRNRGLPPGCGQMFSEDLDENKDADNGVPRVVVEGISGKRPFGRTPHSSSGGNQGSSSSRERVLTTGKKSTPFKQHISSSPRVPIPLPANQTYTGLDKQSLVIKPGYLPQNWTYVVQVSAKAPDMKASWAEVYFHVNHSPGKGTCTVRPLKGIEMDTQFSVFCREWKDEHLPLIYEVGYSMGKGQRTSIIYRGASHEITFYLPAGHPSNNHTVLLSVSIRDNFGARTSYCFSPVVVRPKDSRIRDKGDFQQNGNSGTLDPLVLFKKPYQKAKNHGDDRATCTLIGNMAAWMNRSPKVNVSSQEGLLRQQTRNKLLDDLLKLPLRDEVELIQIAQSLAATTAVPQELSTRSLKRALRLLESIQTQTEVLYADIADPGEDILTLAIQAVSSIIGASVELADKQGPETLTIRAMTVLDKLLQVELNHHSIGEAPIKRSAEFVSVLGSRYTPKLSTIININAAQFKLPSNMAAITQTSRKVGPNQESSSMNAECFQAHMTSFKKNPFSHHGDQIWKVEAEVLALNLYSCDGQNISVKNLPTDAEVFIQIPQQERERATYSAHVLDKKYMNVHQFNLTRQNLVQPFHISIQLEPVSGRSFPISLLIGQFHHPSPQRYYLRQNFATGQDNITVFLPAGTFNDSGMYYLGIVDSHFNAGRHREGQVLARNYTFSLWLDNCLFWDEKQSAWSPHGCQVMEDSTAEQMHCRCNHLTAFGGHIDLVANDLNFINVDSFFSLHENPVTIVLVCLVFCTYFILLALCRQADLHDEKKGRVVYLTDNGGSDKQQYEVIIETGFRMGAGSTAKISMIIHGDEGMSETRELISDDNRPLFERNSRDKFVMTHPDSLGKIWKVQLWHNNSGPSPSWYLSRVLVRDLVTGHKYYFLCERWFAVEEDDGKVEREIMALDGDIGFSTVFWAKGTQYMADFHLWTSLMTRPAHSRFTRTQRLTCCLTLLMSYMCLNAMWYKQTETEVRGEFGLLDASWQNVSVGAIICSLIIPLNLLLGFLFRRSKVRYPGSEPDKSEYVSGKPSEEVSREHEDETVQPIMTYSLLDQSILNWQSIQDWAQKQWIKREQAVHSGSNSVKTSHPSSPQTPAPPVLLTLRKEEETDVASSGFEDSTSQAYSQGVADKNRVQPTTTPSPCQHHKCQDSCHRDHHRHHTSRRVFLPFWCRYVAWTLCAVISVGCAGITVLYGFRFGKTKSTMWLQSLYFSFMMCIFIAQPFLILLTVVYTAMKYRQDPCVLDHYDDGFYGINNELARRRKQREVECEEWEELERGVAARQRCRYLRFARPPQEKTLIEARKKIIREKKTLCLFSDSAVFSVMFLLLTVMAYGRDTASPFYCNQAMKDAFVNAGEMPFSQIKTRGDWFQWSKTTLLEGVYSQSVSVTPTQPHKQMAIGHLNSYLIGEVHVRQLRVDQEDCSNVRYITTTSPCRYQYSSSRRDDSVMGSNSSWTDPVPYSFLLWGKHGTYDPTGSTIRLSRNRSDACKQLLEMEESSWLDVQTRAVIVELTLFNVPTNLFSSITLLLEFPPTGGADPYPIIMATRVFCYISAWDNCVLACELVFVVLTLLKIQCELCEIVRNQAKYFNNLWNYLEFTFGLLSLTYVVCYVFRFVLVADIVEDLRNTFYEEFVNVSFLALWDEILRALVGLLLFFVIVKFVPLLRYITVCGKYCNIYKRARKEIILFMALFAFILCAFTSLGVVLFGSVSLRLRNAWFGLWSMTALMVRIHAPPDLEVNSSPWWLLFVFSYLVFGVGLLTSYMVAVMSRRLKVYKHGDVSLMGLVDSIKCLYQKLLLCSGFQRVQPIEEPENVLPPEFTMAEIEYQVDELLFRMNNLAGSSSLPEKPQGYLTDSTDASNEAGDDGISSGGGSEDQAGVGTDRLELRVQKIEDKLYANEPYLAQLLKLDSIGADVLSQEKEKQLRSHLEMEIFRQLQMQRQEHGGNTQLVSNQNPGINAALHGRSMERSPSSASNGSHKLPLLELPKTKDLVAGLAKPKTKPGVSPKVPERSRSDVRSPQSLVSPSGIQPEAGSSSPESPHNKRSGDTRPKVKVGPPVPPKPVSNLLLTKGPSSRVGKSGKPSSSSENASPQSSESEKVHRRTDSSSGQSGSIERTGSVKQPTIKPELPPKPTFIQTTLDEHAHFDSSKSLSGSSQKQRQFKLPPERVLQRGDLCGNIAAESSSGSEQDAAHFGRRPSGKRNLRKTKSRGKGKGSGGLSPALMLEDLTLDNPEIEDLEQVDMLEENIIQEQEL